MWRGCKVCAHTVAVAESLKSLKEFVDALHKSKPECNLTKLITTSNDTGTKSSTPRRRGSSLCQVPITAYRSRIDDVCSPDPGQYSSATTGHEQSSTIEANSSYIGRDVNVGCSSPTYNYHPQSRSDYPYYTPSPWYVSHPYQSIPSEPYGMYGYNYNPYCSPYGSTFQSESSESKPFVVKLLNNRIKKCRGCNREFSRKVDGSLPDPPLNVVVCHEERRPFRDSSNVTRLSRPQNVYYHANLSCIRANNPHFLPFHLHIPPDSELSDAHKKYLREHTGCDC